MNYLFIILPAIAIVTIVTLYIFSRNAQEIEENDVPVIKFEPRKMTVVHKGEIGTDPVKEEPVVAPKKKKTYYKKRPKRSE